MTPEVRDAILERIAHRADRLARVLRTQSCPTTIWVMMAFHLFQTVVLVGGKELAWQALDWAIRANAVAFGVCRLCLEHPLVKKLGMCQPCWDQLAQEDREAERCVDLAEQPPKGGIS